MSDFNRFDSLSDQNPGQQWMLISQSGTLDARIAALEASCTDLTADAVLFGELHAKDVARQALLFAAGQQPQNVASPGVFTLMTKSGDRRLSNFVCNLDPPGMTCEVFAAIADKMMSAGTDIPGNRSVRYGALEAGTDIPGNRSVRYGSLEAVKLNEDVLKCLSLFARHKELQKLCFQEYVVLNNFDLLQKTFGNRGGVV